jgi:hypothetical protein
MTYQQLKLMKGNGKDREKGGGRGIRAAAPAVSPAGSRESMFIGPPAGTMGEMI